MKRILFLICLMAMGVASGCSEQGNTPGANGKKLKLAFVTNNASDFWKIAQAGIQKAEKDLGDVSVDVQMPSDGAAATQIEIIKNLLVRGVDGIAMSPKDPANMTTLINDAAKTTLVICHDSDAPNSNRAVYIGTDNVAAGKQAGDLIKKALPSGGKIMLFVGSRDAQNAKERGQGIADALKGSNISIIDTLTDEADPVKAKTNAIDTLVKHSDIACLVGLWSYNGPALVAAVKDKGQTGKVKIVCFDEEEATLQGVKDGVVFGTIVQQPFKFGEESIKVMREYLRGNKSVIPESKKIIVDTKVVNKENVDQFWADLKKMTGK